MTRARVKITIAIETKNDADRLTSSERWDIISSLVVAVRAAIVQYVDPKEHAKTLRGVQAGLQLPLPSNVKFKTYKTTFENDN